MVSALASMLTSELGQVDVTRYRLNQDLFLNLFSVGLCRSFCKIVKCICFETGVFFPI